jgi:D-alanyl-D-alanine carboxypeptidase (penicillin-binding protein 5/6)
MNKQAAKKIIILALLLWCAGFCGGSQALAVQATGAALPQFTVDATSAVLLDALSGQTLFEQNAGEKLAPASLVKLMTLYIAYDAIKMGLVKIDDGVLISKKAWATQGSKMFVQVGSRVELLTLLQGIASVSGNDACIAVAEHIAGMEEAFVPKMNEKAGQLGMNNTNFVNVSGLPAEDQYSTAADIATLAYHYLADHPEALPIHSITTFTFSGITQHNRNGLLLLNEGVDGLKTGWISDDEGFHLVATALRNGQRFISVVMGAKNRSTRESEALKLLNFGFKNFSTATVFKAQEPLAVIRVWKGTEDQVALIAREPGIITVAAGDAPQLSFTKTIPERIYAPVSEGQTMGEGVISLKGKTLKKVALVTRNAVPSCNIFKRLFHSLLLSFYLPPYLGWFALAFVTLGMVIVPLIRRKLR